MNSCAVDLVNFAYFSETLFVENYFDLVSGNGVAWRWWRLNFARVAVDFGFSADAFYADCVDDAADVQTTAGVAVDAFAFVDAVDNVTTSMIFGV